MNYTYTSARVSALENMLLAPDAIDMLLSCNSAEECIRRLNADGFEGNSVDEILRFANKRIADISSQLIENPNGIAVLYYEKTFHNLKAAVKRVCSDSSAPMYVDGALAEGGEIEKILRDGAYEDLPDLIKSAAAEAHKTLLRTGDGRLSDIIVDRACLEAFVEFAKTCEYEILRKYALETVAVANIKTVFRAKGETDILQKALCECPFFSKDALIKASEDEKSLTDYLSASGFSDIDVSNLNAWGERRIKSVLHSEKYNIFTPGPAVNFIVALQNEANLLRLILVCKANGVDGETVKRKAVAFRDV